MNKKILFVVMFLFLSGQVIGQEGDWGFGASAEKDSFDIEEDYGPSSRNDELGDSIFWSKPDGSINWTSGGALDKFCNKANFQICLKLRQAMLSGSIPIYTSDSFTRQMSNRDYLKSTIKLTSTLKNYNLVTTLLANGAEFLPNDIVAEFESDDDRDLLLYYLPNLNSSFGISYDIKTHEIYGITPSTDGEVMGRTFSANLGWLKYGDIKKILSKAELEYLNAVIALRIQFFHLPNLGWRESDVLTSNLSSILRNSNRTVLDFHDGGLMARNFIEPVIHEYLSNQIFALMQDGKIPIIEREKRSIPIYDYNSGHEETVVVETGDWDNPFFKDTVVTVYALLKDSISWTDSIRTPMDFLNSHGELICIPIFIDEIEDDRDTCVVQLPIQFSTMSMDETEELLKFYFHQRFMGRDYVDTTRFYVVPLKSVKKYISTEVYSVLKSYCRLELENPRKFEVPSLYKSVDDKGNVTFDSLAIRRVIGDVDYYDTLPHLYLSNGFSLTDSISLEKLKQYITDSMVLIAKDGITDRDYGIVVGYTFTCVGRKSNGPKRVDVSGNSLQPILRYLDYLQNGDLIQFYNIRAVLPDKRVIFLENTGGTLTSNELPRIQAGALDLSNSDTISLNALRAQVMLLAIADVPPGSGYKIDVMSYTFTYAGECNDFEPKSIEVLGKSFSPIKQVLTQLNPGDRIEFSKIRLVENGVESIYPGKLSKVLD
ncbi:MAG: hypothetical protein O3B78_09235 [Bacteroidetes bacterium]|nr:hypothetical protein [Bacteroidota bacterium]